MSEYKYKNDCINNIDDEQSARYVYVYVSVCVYVCALAHHTVNEIFFALLLFFRRRCSCRES